MPHMGSDEGGTTVFALLRQGCIENYLDMGPIDGCLAPVSAGYNETIDGNQICLGLLAEITLKIR